MATKKAAKTIPATDEEYTNCVPLRRCGNWGVAAGLARRALAFIVCDGSESAANRIKAAELILDRAYGRPAASLDHDVHAQSFEDWLVQQEGKSRL
jgi:hypothetical protein